MAEIHPTAIVSPKAELGEKVVVSAYAIIGEEVEIGAGTVIGAHTVIEGPTTIGKDNKIGAFVHIGGAPQHIEYKGEKTGLKIGDRNQFREFVTINRGTSFGMGETIVGNDNFLMIGCHIAHDCVVGDGVIMANYVQIAGHCQVENNAVFGGLSGLHQHCRVGRAVMVGAITAVTLDAPPFSMVIGERAKFVGLNLVGLKRMGFSEEKIKEIKKAYRIIRTSDLLLEETLKKLEQEMGEIPEVKEIIRFFKNTQRGVIIR